MRILLTGAAGFIGTAVAARLLADGHEVVGLDCWHPNAHGAKASDVDGVVGGDAVRGNVVRGDVRDGATVARLLRGVDVVVHHAAMVGMGVDLADLPEYVSCNDLATAVLLAEMARAGVRRLVLASSMVVYGEGAYDCAEHGRVNPAQREAADLAAGRFDPGCPVCRQPLVPALVDEDAQLRPRSVYAATKLAKEHLAEAWARACDAAVVALRYHNVYGPGMPRDTPYAGVAAIFRSALERGSAPLVYEDGAQRRDFVHVDDVAKANAVAVAHTGTMTGLRPYNIASGQPHTVGDMAAALTSALGGPDPIVTGRFRAGDVRHIVAAPARAAAELGFTAAVRFETGMAEFATAALRGQPA